MSPSWGGARVAHMGSKRWRHGRKEDLVGVPVTESIKEVRWAKRDRKANQDRGRLSRLFGPLHG